MEKEVGRPRWDWFRVTVLGGILVGVVGFWALVILAGSVLVKWIAK